jgi:RNA polymerase sigma-70 factor, ECF subfamily
MEQLVKASYPAVWRLCRHLVDEASADDLAQETFLRAARSLSGFRGHANLRTWILSVARHTCMDELRARYRRERRDRRLAQAPPDAQRSVDPEGEVTTSSLLAQLEPERRAAFVLTQMLGLSYEQTAEVCGCPTGTIRSRVARARDDLIGLAGFDSSFRRNAGG